MSEFVSKRALITIAGVGLATVYLLLPATFGVATVFPHHESVGSPPEGFEQLTLNTDDGVALQAWYGPPSNGVAIVLIHGAGNSRESVRDYAACYSGTGMACWRWICVDMARAKAGQIV